MASIRAALTYLLKQDTGVMALTNGRVYPNKAPQRRDVNDPLDPGAFPRITMRRVSRRAAKSQQGQTGLARVRVQIECWGLTAGDAEATQEAVQQAQMNSQGLDGWKQTAINGLYVCSIWLEEVVDDYTPDQHYGEVGVFATAIDALCWYWEK